MKRRDLERELEAVPGFDSPDPDREQYRTPAAVAADLLWAARANGDIDGKRVLDLGCGTGILSRASILMGAATVIGVDTDTDALAMAARVVPEATFVHADVTDWTPPPVDTVVMNPPFGAQKGNRNADRAFLDAAAACDADAVWTLAPIVSERFLDAYATDLGMTVQKVEEWQMPLPATMAHHQDAVRTISVGGYRLTRQAAT